MIETERTSSTQAPRPPSLLELTPLESSPPPAYGSSLNCDSGSALRRQEPPNPSPSDGSSTNGEDEEERFVSSDACLELVYAQWIWPLVVFVWLEYSREARYLLSMLGNALFLASLCWIKSRAAASTTGCSVQEGEEGSDGSPKAHCLALSDVVPTVVWGILFLFESPGELRLLCIFTVCVTVLLPLSSFLLACRERDRCKPAVEALAHYCSSRVAPFPFTQPITLEEQQEILNYLEDLPFSDRRNFRSRWRFRAILTFLFIALFVSHQIKWFNSEDYVSLLLEQRLSD